MTGPGTNTYVVGHDDLIVIDPGPGLESHLQAIASFCSGRCRYVVITHGHADHAPGARALAASTGASLLGFAKTEHCAPDGLLSEGDVLVTRGWRLETLHTPGHASDHLCFFATVEPAAPLPAGSVDPGFSSALFTGDHIMGGSTVVVAPPDGDMGRYFASLQRLSELDPAPEVILPGHGGLIADPKALIASYLAHRRAREQSVLALLAEGPARPEELVRQIYGELSERIALAARATIWAHLRKLGEEGRVTTADGDQVDSHWSLG